MTDAGQPLPPCLGVRRFDRTRRLIEVVAALAGLTLAAPVMLLIAIAIPIDTPGPVLYSQMRIGRGGRHFRLYKFRKFRHPGEATDQNQKVTLKNDPRMTRVGRLIERTKLDELPQLWNVLVADMAIVGPRPESVEFADCFAGPLRSVLDYTPGLFGPNQVIFRNERCLYPEDRDPHEFYRRVLFPAKARVDLSYFPRRNVISDIGWVARGVLGLSSSGADILDELSETKSRLTPATAAEPS